MTGTSDIRLARGDVARIAVARERGSTRLLVYQVREPLPLIQAILSGDERDALVAALRSDNDGPPGNA